MHVRALALAMQWRPAGRRSGCHRVSRPCKLTSELHHMHNGLVDMPCGLGAQMKMIPSQAMKAKVCTYVRAGRLYLCSD